MAQFEKVSPQSGMTTYSFNEFAISLSLSLSPLGAAGDKILAMAGSQVQQK